MPAVNSPNMNLPIPSVGTTQGPDYANNVNSSLTLVDQHDHSPGKGVQITPAGININASLSFNTNNITNMGQIIFSAQPSASALLQSLYVAPGSTENDLFFTDSNGVAVQITSGGNVNATAASIPGESYAAGTFTWVQGTGSTTPANFDIGSITIRPNTALTTNGVTLTPPGGIASQYNVALPLVPASTSLLTIDSSGNMLSNSAFPITAASIANGTITTTQISATAGILGSQLSATAGIVGTQLADATIPVSKMGAVTTATTADSGPFSTTGSFTVVTNQSTSFTAVAGRPVYITFRGASTPTAGSTGCIANTGGQGVAQFGVFRGGTLISQYSIPILSGTANVAVPVAALNTIDFPGAGTFTYTLQAAQNSGGIAQALGVHMLIFQV